MRFRVAQLLLISVCAVSVTAPALGASSKGKTKAATPAPAKPEPEPVAAPEPEPEPEPVAAAEPEPAYSASASAVSAPPPAPANRTRPTILFLEGGFRWDLGTFSRSERVGQNVQNNNDEVNAFGPMFHLGMLSRVDDVWRIGGAFGYGGNYDLNNNNQLLGQLLTADFRAEASVQVDDRLWLFGQPKVGLSAIIPGGILQDAITANQAAGYDTWSGPRWGFLLGVDAGARYYLNDWLSLRASVGYLWSMSFLMDSHASAGDISASKTWQLQASRVSGNAGIEVSF